jgi:hypothetical protein
LHLIKFENGQAMVAESGSASLSGRVIEIFKKEAAATKIIDESTIAKLLEKSVREVKNSLTSQYPQSVSPKEWQDYFYDPTNWFELMLAFYSGEKPYLYKFNPLWCIPAPVTANFATSGIGSELADYLLSNLLNARNELELRASHGRRPAAENKISCEEAAIIAVYVTETVKQHAVGCNGPTRLGFVRHPSRISNEDQVLVISDLDGNIIQDDRLPVFIPCQPEIEKLVKRVSDMDAITKVEFWIKIEQALIQVMKAQTEQYRKVAKSIESKSGKKKTTKINR